MLFSNQTFSTRLSMLVFFGLSSFPARSTAQVVPDGSLPTTVEEQGSAIEINGGAREGNHLFHSFESFSVPEGISAIFNNALDLENIFTRVTGSSISQINGILKTQGTANLFLLNPNGIVFGENGRLDVGGSFIGTTANSIQFEDGTEFAASRGVDNPILTVSVPVGLGFGSEAGAITVRGTGDNNFGGLVVPSGATLGLVGGDINVAGGNLIAEGGNIELGSVGGGETVGLTSENQQWQLSYQGVEQFQDIQLSQAASVDASGNSGGTVQVQGRQINLRDGSAILAETLGDSSGGDLNLTASESIDLANSLIFNNTISAGQGGNIVMETGNLRLSEGSQILVQTFGAGDSGQLDIVANNIEIKGVNSLKTSSSISTNVQAEATGDGGDINIEADRLYLSDSSQISSDTLRSGDAGDINLTVSDIKLTGGISPSAIFANVSPEATGNGGNINIDSKNLQVSEGSQIAVQTFGEGNSGNIDIMAEDLEIISIDESEFSSTTNYETFEFSSTIRATTFSEATGNGGDVNIEADLLSLSDGGRIISDTSGTENAGNINIIASNIEMTNANSFAISNVSSTTAPESTGNGGYVKIEAKRLFIADGSQLATTTTGAGDAGNLIVRANQIELTGSSSLSRSGLLANAIIGSGNGGDLDIVTDLLSIDDGAIIGASNFQSLNQFSPGTGSPGNIDITAETINLSESSITANTLIGDRGSIILEANNIQLTGGSQITTNAENTNGGNVNLNTDTLVILDSSSISANALEGNGGNIQINGEGFFVSSDSNITASSELGIDGMVEIDTPETNLVEELEPQNYELISTKELLANSCFKRRNHQSKKFVYSGSGGTPISPYFGLDEGDQSNRAQIFPEEQANQTPQATIKETNTAMYPQWQPGDIIVEGQILTQTADGQIFLAVKSEVKALNSLTCQPQ